MIMIILLCEPEVDVNECWDLVKLREVSTELGKDLNHS